MDPERYRVLKRAFAEVCEAPEVEREEALRRACGDDLELRREVEALLRHDRTGPGGLLEGPPAPARLRSGEGPGSSFEGDFAPGEVLIGRYRIVALVGEGGMGQVYLADDLVLAQPVAVKFLPRHIAHREGGLERFRAEVRHAREVTHPNVARVHDIGEVDGRHFLTMEFVDGEDLASLIRRIGRLPGEKAAEIAQQICAGLGEAHRKGVLHRDLKPSNVMLDGEGRVRLTDFGLAVATGASGDSALAGTPQYMAPEQLSGVAASVQSEVYALGLLLYELYTGHRALRGHTLEQLRLEHEEGGPDAPSSHLEQLDPSVDAVLTRCLARDPAERPRSVTEVARALPGGDPLAAALAAGQTPAPHLVAGAPTEGSLTPARAAWLALGVAGLFLLLLVGRTELQEAEGVSYGKPAAYLRERARELATELAGTEGFAHEVHWYTKDETIAATTARDALAGYPSALVHHSRFGPVGFARADPSVGLEDPAAVPGSCHLVLDVQGRLVSWQHRPEGSSPGQAPPPWERVLELTDLPAATLHPVEPRGVPEVFADRRAAWRIGPDDPPAEGAGELRIEAAALDGQVVELALRRDATRLGTYAPASPGSFTGSVFFLALLVVAAWLAWNNVRAGRADVSGAALLGAYESLVHLGFLFGRPLPDDLEGAGVVLGQTLSYALYTGVQVTLIYLALEPFARKRWPRVLIGWNRLLEGRLRDESIGREVLWGLLGGATLLVVNVLSSLGLQAAGRSRTLIFESGLAPLLGLEGPLQSLSHLLHTSGDAMMIVGILVLGLVGVRSLVRSPWLAGLAWVALMTPLVRMYQGTPSAVAFLTLLLVLLMRVGFLSTVVMFFASVSFISMPLTLRAGDWYFGSSAVVLATFGLLWLGAWRAAVVGRSRAGPAPR